MLNIDSSLCTGCRLCAAVCPAEAISFENKNGFPYPTVHEDKCMSCHACEEVCPATKPVQGSGTEPAVYAAWSTDNARRTESTSGGICYELSKSVLERGGMVAGVSWADGFRNAQYELIDDEAGLRRITQTKYFQPRVGDIYQRVRVALDAGREVLFIGTSCGNAALQNYLGKAYDNLYTCDFICRGYTSQIYHQKRVERLEKKHGSRLTGFQYKNKNDGWLHFGTLLRFENGESEFIPRNQDPYELMFAREDLNTRPSCYSCRYRRADRKTDLTVGDFWGIRGVSEEDCRMGVSALLVNTPKGERLVAGTGDRIHRERRILHAVEIKNPSLTKALQRRPGAERFFHDLETKGTAFVDRHYGAPNRGKKLQMRVNRFKKVLGCDILQYLYLNYFCPNVVRNGDKRAYPYRGAHIKIEKGGKLELNGNLSVNTLKHEHSREEAFVTIRSGGSFSVNGETCIAANSTVDVLPDAELAVRDLDTNQGATIVCSNRISIGYGVQLGRNVTIYDSNYHKTGLNSGDKKKTLEIGNHAWLCTGVTIAKAVKIGNGAICGLNATIMKNVKSGHMVIGNPAKEIMSDAAW